jgi:hypothetical protein
MSLVNLVGLAGETGLMVLAGSDGHAALRDRSETATMLQRGLPALALMLREPLAQGEVGVLFVDANRSRVPDYHVAYVTAHPREDVS